MRRCPGLLFCIDFTKLRLKPPFGSMQRRKMLRGIAGQRRLGKMDDIRSLPHSFLYLSADIMRIAGDVAGNRELGGGDTKRTAHVGCGRTRIHGMTPLLVKMVRSA
jgi:hypothetical protein